MKHPRPRIYLDTSVISYHTARLHRDPAVRSRQLTTKRWWGKFHDFSDFYISAYVEEEISRGDEEAAASRIHLVSGMKTFQPTTETKRLAQHLLRKLRIPQRSESDAYHLAIAALNRIDYIVSWNFKHMANDEIRKAYAATCESVGLTAPEIITPEAMLNRGEET